MGLCFVYTLYKKHIFSKVSWTLPIEHARAYVKEFYRYCHPLFLYSVIGLITGIFDRWLLQIYGGSIQQGFFSLSYQIGAVCFLFSNAMAPLLMREFSIANGKNDLAGMGVLFRRYIPMLYSVAAYFSCFVALQADKIIYLFGGDKYKEAMLTLVIMAFYPMHQTYGQLSASVFYATGKTKVLRNIGVVFMLIGAPTTYFIVAPQTKMGLDGGSIGLAIKMVLIQFVAVNIQLYFNSKLLTLNFWKYFTQQLVVVSCLLILGVFSRIGTGYIIDKHATVFAFLLSGITYTLMVFALVYYVPQIFGLKKQDINTVVDALKKCFSTKTNTEH